MAVMPVALILLCAGRGPTTCAVGWYIPSCSAPCSGPAPIWRSTARRSLVLFGASALGAGQHRLDFGAGLAAEAAARGELAGTRISVGAGLALTALLIFWGHGWLTGIPLH